MRDMNLLILLQCVLAFKCKSVKKSSAKVYKSNLWHLQVPSCTIISFQPLKVVTLNCKFTGSFWERTLHFGGNYR